MAKTNPGLEGPLVQTQPYWTPSTLRPPLISTYPNILSDRPRRAKLVFDDNGPGELIEDGPRHDNDYANYKDIHILPTVDEILSVGRPTYMPQKNINQPHFLGNTLNRLLDIHFRHLRYDNTESLRDICYTAAQQAFIHNSFNTDDDLPFQETLSGNRYQLYNNVKLEDLIAHEKKGMLVRFSFDCPPSLQGPLMHKSTRLQSGMLCALMIMDVQTQELSVLYFDIHLRQSTFSMEPRGSRKRRAAVQVALCQSVTHEEVLKVTRLASGLCHFSRMILVEFPKVLRQGFYPHLRRLQQLSTTDMAFRDYLLCLLPNKSTDKQLKKSIAMPQYTEETGFRYDLTALTGVETSMKLPQDFIGSSIPDTVAYLRENTTLDEGQAVALCHSLGREFSFTQGPPGTGKTFLGIAIAQVLQASRKSSAKPIIVVCLTNHALDAFLAGLRDAGVTNLLRIGSGSKEGWTKAINLREKARQSRSKGSEARNAGGIRSQIKHNFAELSSWCESLSHQIENGRPNWHQIEPVLKASYPEIHRQLQTVGSNPEAQSFAFDYWAAGGDINHIGNFHNEMSSRLLKNTHYRPQKERDLVQTLLQEICTYTTGISNDLSQEKNIWQLSPRQRQGLLVE